MIGICFEIKTTCKYCEHPLMLNAYVEEIICSACNKTNSFSSDSWKNLLEDTFEGIDKLTPGEGQTTTSLGGEYNYNLIYGRQEPRCGNCKQSIDVSKIEEYSLSDGVKCLKCSHEIFIRKPVEFISKAFPLIKYLVGEDADLISEHPTTEPLPQSVKPVLFTCPSCGGNLEIDGKNRMLTCKFCSSQIYLPDDLWFRLHPSKEVQRWYVLYDNSSVSNEFPGWYHIPGFTIDKDCNCYLASCDNYSENFIVWSFGPDLKVRWIRKGLKYDHDKTGLCLTSDGNLYLWSGLKHSLLKLSSKDGSTISINEGKPPSKDDPYAFNLLGCETLVSDSDGSILALINNTVVRFNAEGKRIQLWNGKFLGLIGSGIGGKIPPDDSGSAPKVKDIFWSNPKRIDSGSTNMNIGWDGYLYMLDMTYWGSVLKFDKSGKKIKRINIPLDYRECIPWADKEGNLYIVGKNKEDKTNLLKISADGKNKQILLTDIKEGGVLNEEDKLALAPDGTVYLYSYYKSMKAFSPDLKMIYRSKQSEEEDEEVRLEIKETIEKDEEIS
jgi:hypothetical protein